MTKEHKQLAAVATCDVIHYLHYNALDFNQLITLKSTPLCCLLEWAVYVDSFRVIGSGNPNIERVLDLNQMHHSSSPAKTIVELLRCDQPDFSSAKQDDAFM